MDYTQLTPQQLIELKHEQQNFLWEAKHGDNRIYTPEKIRQAQNDIETSEEHELYLLVEAIQAELSKPSQSEDGWKAFNLQRELCEERLKENAQLKSKLAEAEKDAKRYQFIKLQMHVGSVQTQLPLYRTLHWIGYEECGNVNDADATIDLAISNNTKELG